MQGWKVVRRPWHSYKTVQLQLASVLWHDPRGGGGGEQRREGPDSPLPREPPGIMSAQVNDLTRKGCGRWEIYHKR